MYFDSHTHLNSEELFPKYQTHIQNFFNIGGEMLINIGVNHNRNQKSIEIAKKYKFLEPKRIFSAIGIHPIETIFGKIKNTIDIDNVIKQLETLYTKNTSYIIAIGECGNDAHYGNYSETRLIQQNLFYKQCLLARKFNLPIVIHSRDHFEDSFHIIKKFKDLKVYFHCRGYTEKEIQKLHEHFPRLWIGFCGNISYSKAHDIRKSFQKIQTLQKSSNINQHQIQFLFETDAPYLSPQKKRGEINTPENVKYIYEYVSREFNISLEQLEIQGKKSFYSLFNIPS